MMSPVSMSKISFHFSLISWRVQSLTIGISLRLYGVPRPVENTWSVIPEASCVGPHTMSEAGVAIKFIPLFVGISAGPNTSTIGELPDFAILPIDFSLMFESPPFLLPGVVFALLSTPPFFR